MGTEKSRRQKSRTDQNWDGASVMQLYSNNHQIISQAPKLAFGDIFQDM